MSKPRKNDSGAWTLVVQYAGQRRKLTLGKVPKSHVDDFCRNVEAIIEHVKYGGKSLGPRLQTWINNLADRHRLQLSEIGLFEYQTALTVGQLADLYVADYKKQSHADSTKTKVKSTVKNRLGKLREISLSDIEPVQRSARQNAEPVFSDAAKSTLADFNSWQRNHYSAATWTRDNKLLSSIGIWAVKHGYCDHNPFVGMPTASMVNEERLEYISAEMAIDAMEQCYSPDIRLTIAMGRFAGMRTDSEVRTMKWSHVDVDGGILTVIDSKKKEPRKMPLFQRIRDELERQRAVTGHTRYVASSDMRRASSSTNYQRIKEAVERSGQTAWPRLRQNLRSSCENDLLEIFDERLVTQWIGHTVTVSRKHYQKLRPSDYTNAIEVAASHGLNKVLDE
ncbi:Phage integrase family protein [Stieleria maiorica]|uniref:Phage integrase family protein n=1 Tax=Stieleria maiorica TaxID=2795974 RepID=A0A5B9MF26_9BACT|nr:site-specific integrase [Stieleria maiorica]QEF98135.1 Phage integrase family protein [Stieleria maiorica]